MERSPEMMFVIFAVAVFLFGLGLELVVKIFDGTERICQGPHKRDDNHYVFE